MNDLYGPLDEKKRKLTKKPSSETSLRDWFGRKGAPGKKGGWVDCNTCRKGKCKPCGRSGGEKRSKYPRCRPTPSACKGFKSKKSKKSKKNEDLFMDLEQIIVEELEIVLNENREEIAQIARELTSGQINEADAIEYLVALGKDREWAKNWVTLVKSNPGMFSEAKKKKKKKKAKRDACYHKVKSRYKVWPSAYASGALSKCRKVGAKNWGNSKKEHLEIMIEDELAQVLIERKQKRGGKKCWDGYERVPGKVSGQPGSCRKKTKRNIKEEEEKSDLKSKVIKALRDEGGAAGMNALKKHTKASSEEINKVVDSADNIKVHEDGDIILMDSLEEKKKPCKPSKGKRFAKRVNGKCRSFGQKGQAKGGGDRIRPGTAKGDAYCARSAKIKKCKNPPCANALSRKKWKCRGSKSMKEQNETTN